MITNTIWSAVLVGVLGLGLASGACLSQGTGDGKTNLGTATPYRLQQDLGSYQPPPEDFTPIYTHLLARHGSRGLSSPKLDLAVYNMWRRAASQGALTELGARLGPDLEKIMRANALLGYGVPGITKPGYGNETQLGMREHTELAQRLLARLPGLWKAIADNATGAPRRIVVVNSGVDRAADSEGFFVRSLTTTEPKMAGLLTKELAPVGYPQGAAKLQPAGTNRFLLYFHKLVPSRDLVSDASDRYFRTYRDSQAYQQYLKSTEYKGKHGAILDNPDGEAAGRSVLERLFKKPFVDAFENGTFAFTNTGSMTFTSEDGKFANRVTGDGKTKIKSAADAGLFIYQLYAAAPAVKSEAGVDMTPYLTAEQASTFAQVEDALAFYRLGPGITETADITYRMAQILQDDFFGEVDAIASGDLKHAAKLRFAHAEIVAPFASKLGLKNVLVQVPIDTVFNYANDPWRGKDVVPMAANVQWDVFADSRRMLLVKMLHNEREMDFKADCDGAKLAPDSHYYDFRKLSACYGYKPQG
jgi:hypothetical protein